MNELKFAYCFQTEPKDRQKNTGNLERGHGNLKTNLIH